MNILILHNNNIPVDLRLSFEFDGNAFHSEVVNYPPYERGDFDSFLCMRLFSLFQKAQYDLIVLPYTLGEDNYSEYTGLRIAAHIRLTPHWQHFMTPLLFIGGDDPIDVLRFSDLGGLLYTYRVHTSHARTREEHLKEVGIIDCTRKDVSYKEWLGAPQYQQFLNRISIKSPANYATHHSLANKWAVLRWIEMFSWGADDAPIFDDESFKSMLYFKYLMAQSGVREVFTNKYKKNEPIKPKIVLDPSSYKSITKKNRVVYVDDEESMWSKVLAPIFQNSNVDFVSYHFDKHNKLEKSVLLQDIMSFLQQDYIDNGGADCYLIDLRLHDDDFADKIKSEDLSGQQIARFIKKEAKNDRREKVGLNEGSQIVIFTASNKSWNIEESMIKTGACGYVLKESPEMNYSREESYQLFRDFSNKIREAFNLSYLRQLYQILDGFNYRLTEKDVDLAPLFDYADLLDLDKGKNNNIIIKSCTLCQFRFIETLLLNKHQFYIKGNGDIIMDGREAGNCYHRILFHSIKEKNGYKTVADVDFTENIRPLTKDDYWEYANENSDISRIVAALLIYYGIKLIDVKLTVKLKYERNTTSAHGDKVTSITVSDLQEHFEKVIVPILEKETEN